jgi:hypothetical protein
VVLVSQGHCSQSSSISSSNDCLSSHGSGGLKSEIRVLLGLVPPGALPWCADGISSMFSRGRPCVLCSSHKDIDGIRAAMTVV